MVLKSYMYIIAAELYSSPSTSAWGKLGTLLPSMAAFPRWSRMPSLPQRWAMASPSSCPVCLASALPSFLTSLSAHGCQPPSHQREEGNPLLPTVLFSSPELAVMGKVEGMTGLRGCPHHCGVLEGVDHRHVKGSISSPCPERHQDIRWAAVSTWQQEPPLFAWPKSCTHCRVKEGISQGIVPAYSLSSCSAAEGVVTHDVAETEAGWALGRDPRHRRLAAPACT